MDPVCIIAGVRDHPSDRRDGRSAPLGALPRVGAVQQSIQQTLYPFSTCFGCGPSNPDGLHLTSYDSDEGVVASFQPGAQHSNGMGTLNGGVIATILDCHSGAVVFLASARESESGTKFQPWVTSGLELRYRLPTYLDKPSALKASIASREDGVMVVKATLSYDGKVRVQAESRWVRVSRD